MLSCMKQQCFKLKKHKTIHVYPHPKRPHTELYQHPYVVGKQNKWLHNNIFDAMGCSACAQHGLGVPYHRMTKQRNTKRKELSERVRSMTKAEMEIERLSEYVVMSPSCDLSFIRWWKTLGSDEPSSMLSIPMVILVKLASP